VEDLGIDERYQIPDELWKRMQPLIPPPPRKKNKDRPGRPRMDDRKAMNAIFLHLEDGDAMEGPPKVTRGSEHGPRQVPILAEGWSLREAVEGGAHRVR